MSRTTNNSLGVLPSGDNDFLMIPFGYSLVRTEELDILKSRILELEHKCQLLQWREERDREERAINPDEMARLSARMAELENRAEAAEAQKTHLRTVLQEFAQRENWILDYEGGLPEWQGNADEPWLFAQAMLDGES